MKINPIHAIMAITAAAFMGGCASPMQQAGSPTYPPSNTASYPAPSPSTGTYYGIVDSIQMTPASNNNGVAGAVIGGAVGGLLGNQVGGGDGKSAATVAGVIGGAIVGNQIEQRNRVQAYDTYQISVRTDNGGYQTLVQNSVGDLRVGSRVRIDNGRVSRY